MSYFERDVRGEHSHLEHNSGWFEKVWTGTLSLDFRGGRVKLFRCWKVFAALPWLKQVGNMVDSITRSRPSRKLEQDWTRTCLTWFIRWWCPSLGVFMTLLCCQLSSMKETSRHLMPGLPDEVLHPQSQGRVVLRVLFLDNGSPWKATCPRGHLHVSCL